MIFGFAHGCFDLLHEGHLHFFAEAHTRCEYLIVGINHDDSVRRLKGPGRPVQTIDVRMHAILERARPWVDALIPFDGAKGFLAARLRPQVYFAGYDQATPEDLLKTMRDMKCEVIRLGHLPGHSTSLQLEASASTTRPV